MADVEWYDLPLMEEEVLILREGSTIVFNFHSRIFNKVAAPHLKFLSPISIEEKGDRVILKLRAEEGEELRAWLLLNLGKGFFLTELEGLELS
ncbi:MAG: hypothetical protein NZ954_04110 [Thermofilaceae archaeon]|nr:hypothetical protein [Thermofilaceae archaeon]MDW8004587.1 hypothetical protein [Thermofilaceae archaeon]